MKTAAAVALALAATGFAAPSNLVARETSNVHIGTEIAFRTDNGGVDANPEVTIDQCFDLPQEYWLRLTSISPNGNIKCNAYSGPGCSGVTQEGGWINREVINLASAPWNFDNRAFSLFCTRR
ncbi:hypothetical protein K458DRAFT_391412 [Lentithecium fluviatile CBS 122367]|uniref:Uncharacterized protein n=1 Tax=Lentithecium fluviatile CBS 122367 TaxID=1168545 RepID=A0A6G1IVC9_9PLEO|nr:hypothetical protein K458DRAFT_391412 [Lentithecium fluviatile CBS 122367]